MQSSIIRRLDEVFAEFPILRASGVSIDEIQAASRQMSVLFPQDFQEFLGLYGAAIVGSYPIYGLQPVEPMGNLWNIVEVNRHFHQQKWPGIERWLIISQDLAGNPIGIDVNGTIQISDHDFGTIDCIADDFERFILFCLKQIK